LEPLNTVIEDTGNYGWPPTSVATSDSGSWTTSVSDDRSSESTWPTLEPENKWGQTEEKAPNLNVEALAVGAGNRARMTNTPPFSQSSGTTPSGLGFADSHTRPPQDVAQSQREVEVGYTIQHIIYA
jgi:hypothetical protein